MYQASISSHVLQSVIFHFRCSKQTNGKPQLKEWESRNPPKNLRDAFSFGRLRMEIKLRLNCNPRARLRCRFPSNAEAGKAATTRYRALREMSPSLLGTTALDNYIPLNKIPFAPAVGRGVSPPLNCSVLLLCSTEQLLMFHPRGVCSSAMGEMIKASKALDHLERKVLHKQTPPVLLMLNKANFFP